MKIVGLIFALSLFTLSSSFAKGDYPDLVREIEKKVKIDLTKVDLNDAKTDYVMVSFRIINDEIKIVEIGGSSKELEISIIKELYAIHVDSDYSPNKTYVYRFTFVKI